MARKNVKASLASTSTALPLKPIFYKKIYENLVEGKFLYEITPWNRAETGGNLVQIFSSTQIFMYFVIKNGLYKMNGFAQFPLKSNCQKELINSLTWWACLSKMGEKLFDNHFALLGEKKSLAHF